MKLRKQTLQLLAKAREDEVLVEEVCASERISDEIVGFHCQQAAEKLLKAVMMEQGIHYRRTHDLRELMDGLADAGHVLPEGLVDLDVLTPYGTFFRYEGIPANSELDRAGASSMLRSLRRWVEQKLGQAPQAGGD